MNEDEVKKAVGVLKKGGVILYPTDTIWGLGCDASNKRAITKVCRIKQRLENKNLIILVTSLEEVKNYVKVVPPVVADLLASVTRPLTIIYPDAKNLPDNLVADDGSVGIRVVKNLFCEALIHALGFPMVSTSANISGSEPPFTYSMINPYIIQRVDHIVNIRQENVTEMKSSTIIRVNANNEFTILRD